jgi:rhamnosyltransferase
MNEFDVSVFIPTLNAENHLRLMTPVLTKALNPSQIFIVDSSSTDETISIAQQYDIKTRSIRRHEFNHS